MTTKQQLIRSIQETKEPDGGQEGVRRRYLEWVESHLTCVWEDCEFELQKKKN